MRTIGFAVSLATMSEEEFSKEDRESLIGWLQSRGGTREQAEVAARQMMKRASMDAAQTGQAPIEAMGALLQKIFKASQLMEENLGESQSKDS